MVFMMRCLLIVFVLLGALQANSQIKEVRSWLAEVRSSVFCKQKVALTPFKRLDLTEQDTSGYNNGVFMYHTYIGTIGRDYKRVLSAIEPVAKLSDSSYSFKMVVKNDLKRYEFEGLATLESVYRYKTLTPVWEDEPQTVENYFILVRMKAINMGERITIDGYYGFYAHIDREQVNIYPGATRSFSPYGDVFAGEIKDKDSSFFLQLVPDTYLLGSLPIKKNFLEIDKFQSDYADFDVCRINKKYLNNGWQFTNGEWISTWYSIQRTFGRELYSAINSSLYWNKKD